MNQLRVLFAAAEATPWVKIGGLADVAGGLPRALNASGNAEVRLVLPRHAVLERVEALPLLSFALPYRGSLQEVQVLETRRAGLVLYLIDGAPIRASGPVYSGNEPADAEKYVFFSLALLEFAHLDEWTPQILHLNDWHTALAAYGLRERRIRGESSLKSVLTIHNLPFLGPPIGAWMDAYGLPRLPVDLPPWARERPLPLGLWAADALVTVSPTYAREILTPEYGSGLETFLLSRLNILHGILNGLDTESFDPSRDAALFEPFSLETLSRRRENKPRLLAELGLSVEERLPLLGMVSRIDYQKGVDLVIETLRLSHHLPWQAVFLGIGDARLEAELQQFEREFPDRVRALLRFDATLARRLYAALDLFLMPSRYEPCGIAQMIAMRYGALPLARATGGLKDTIEDGRSGFLFEEANPQAFQRALERALAAYADTEKWEAMQRYAMSRDFSWSRSAQAYLEVYTTLLREHVPRLPG
uniref:Glycogen synthase n=1 Tax=uncultured Chloroflexota bacterium TaxID=166587 RepID=H5SL94_9CHLR|nr:starch synthase [uncultured Chloroflexota bacterium]